MAYIPYESSVDARTGRSGGARLRNPFDASTMGGNTGAGLTAAGEALGAIGDTLEARAEQKAKEKSIYEQSLFDPTDEIEKVKQTVGPDAEGYKDAVRVALLNKISSVTDSMDDDRARVMTKEALLGKLPAYTAQAEAYQRKTFEDTTKLRTNAALAANTNRILSDPTYYEVGSQLNKEMIDVYGKGLPQSDIEAMKTNQGYNDTNTMFEAMTSLARTPAEFDAIQNQMASEQWNSKLMPKDFEDLMQKAAAYKKATQTAMSAEVKANLSSLEEQVKDPRSPIDPSRIAELQASTAGLGDTMTARKVGRVARDAKIMEHARRLNPLQIDEAITVIKNKTAKSPSSVFAEQAYRAASLTGESPALLMNMSGAEYAPGGPEKNPESSATGPFQFIEGTWLGTKEKPGMLRDPAVRDIVAPVALAQGFDINKMTDAQLLELRKNPDVSFLMGAIYTKQNRAVLESTFNRKMTDTEMYMAHFLGSEGAKPLIVAAQANPNVAARSLVSADAYNANKNVFTDKSTGKDFTVAELFTNKSGVLSRNVDSTDFEDIKVYENVAAALRTAKESGNGLKYAADVGMIDAVIPLDQPGGFEKRPVAVEKASAILGFDVPQFTPEEMTYLKTQLDGPLNQKLGVLDAIATMGRPAANKALKQLKQENPAVAHAGQLMLDGDRSTATSILSGVQRLKDNPSLATAVKFSPELASVQFQSVVGAATALWDNEDRESLKKAADAYYMDELAVSGGAYSDSKYKEAVSKVFGFSLAKVNGFDTVLPRGVTQNDVNMFLDKVTAGELMAVSKSGTRPQVYTRSGVLSTPPIEDILPSARLVQVGPGRYRVFPPSGNMPYLAGIYDGESKQFMPYDIELSKDKVMSVIKRTKTATNPMPTGYEGPAA